jgi:hypothetical protein
MTRTELIIQLLKIAIGLAFGAYFVWWSLEVLDRLAPESDGRAHYEGSRNARRFAIDVDARVRMSRGPHADTRLCRDARDRYGRLCQELAAGVKTQEEPSDPFPSACIVRVPEPRP